MTSLGKIRVIDFSRVLSGPYCTMLLGDLGADVIKVEEITEGDPTRHNLPLVDGESHYFLSINRNKRSIALDLKNPSGVRIAQRLIDSADVVVENFRPGTMAKFGLDYASVREAKPEIIYCSISGFGQTGPLATYPAYNDVIQGLSGVMSLNGFPDQPPVKVGLPIGDLAGGLFACIGIQDAIREREHTGTGRHIDISLLDCLVGLLGAFGGWYFATGESPTRVGSNHHSIAPVGVFRTRDGRYLVLSIFTTKFWRNFCKAAEISEYAEDPRFARSDDRVANSRELYELIDRVVAAQDLDKWRAVLDKYDVPYSPVLNVAEALSQPQILHRGMIATVDHPTAGQVKMVGRVIKSSSAASETYRHPPLLGEHTHEVLADCGYGEGEIAEFLRTDTVRSSGSPDQVASQSRNDSGVSGGAN